jgi:hypothetical protein
MAPVRATVLSALLVVAAACGAGGGATHPAPAPISNVPGPDPAPSESCTDPIAGKWRARVYRTDARKIDEVTLTLTRAGEELRGAIIVTSWDVNGIDGEPPTCPDGSAGISRVTQSANGWFRGGEVDIAGSDPERTATPCDTPPISTYNPDHFTGKLDLRGTLVTTNDDGGSDQGRPHVFERVGCPPR